MLERPKFTDYEQQILHLIQSAIARTDATPTVPKSPPKSTYRRSPVSPQRHADVKINQFFSPIGFERYPMSTAFFPIPSVMAPLQDLWRRLVRTSTCKRSTHAANTTCVSNDAINSVSDSAIHPNIKPQITCASVACRPLRVVRILEAGQAPSQVGRMKMSGRMADVCDELDRLAAREAA